MWCFRIRIDPRMSLNTKCVTMDFPSLWEMDFTSPLFYHLKEKNTIVLDCHGCTEADFSTSGLAVHALFTFHPSSTYYNFNCVSLVSCLCLRWDPLCTNRITHLWPSELPTWLCHSSTVPVEFTKYLFLSLKLFQAGPQFLLWLKTAHWFCITSICWKIYLKNVWYFWLWMRFVSSAVFSCVTKNKMQLLKQLTLKKKTTIGEKKPHRGIKEYGQTIFHFKLLFNCLSETVNEPEHQHRIIVSGCYRNTKAKQRCLFTKQETLSLWQFYYNVGFFTSCAKQ